MGSNVEIGMQLQVTLCTYWSPRITLGYHPWKYFTTWLSGYFELMLGTLGTYLLTFLEKMKREVGGAGKRNKVVFSVYVPDVPRKLAHSISIWFYGWSPKHYLCARYVTNVTLIETP